MASVTLKEKYQTTKKAIDKIEIMLSHIKEQKPQLESISYEMARDSLIKRFEFSIDTLWKYLKAYLKEEKGIEQKSPKDVFKECLRQNLISKEETVQALNMIDSRNATSHMYKEELAEQIFHDIPEFHKLMDSIINRWKA